MTSILLAESARPQQGAGFDREVNMSEAIEVRFVGPFSWPGTPDAPSIFQVDEGDKAGIYLWTIALSEGHIVYYVGETGRSFATRMFEHYKEHAAATYHVFSPTEFARGEKIELWPGCRDQVDCIANYSRLTDSIYGMTQILRFLVAPMSCDLRIRHRIEAAKANTLYAVPGMIGAFQDKGIRYYPRRHDEAPIDCTIASQQPIQGLPPQISV